MRLVWPSTQTHAQRTRSLHLNSRSRVYSRRRTCCFFFFFVIDTVSFVGVNSHVFKSCLHIDSIRLLCAWACALRWLLNGDAWINSRRFFLYFFLCFDVFWALKLSLDFVISEVCAVRVVMQLFSLGPIDGSSARTVSNSIRVSLECEWKIGKNDHFRMSLWRNTIQLIIIMRWEILKYGREDRRSRPHRESWLVSVK